MTDLVDQAQTIELLARDRAVDAVRRRASVERRADPVLFKCEDCPGDIEAARLKAHPNAVRCITCQEALERRRQLFPGRAS